MIFRDLYACASDELGRAIAGSGQTLLYRGVVTPTSAIEAADVDYLLAHPGFDPSLSFLAFDAGEPVAYLISRIEADEEGGTAVWTLFGGAQESLHAQQSLLDEALEHWRKAGVQRARSGRTGLLATALRRAEDSDRIKLLADRGFEDTHESRLLVADLAKLSTPEGTRERERELRQKGYFVRPAHANEVALVARKYHPRNTGAMDQEQWNAFIRGARPEGLLVAEFRRQLCGYLGYYGWTLSRERPALGRGAVDEPCRDAGLDAWLRTQALREAKEAGKSAVEIYCTAAAARPYEEMGLQVETRFAHLAAPQLD
jgi:hypothetical protein